jgi:hypothetical protein
MEKEIKDEINKNLIEKMDRKLSGEKELNENVATGVKFADECDSTGCYLVSRLNSKKKDGVERVFEECLELYKRKNHDYSNKGKSAFDKAYEKMGAQSLWLRLNDKFTRFESLLFSEDGPLVTDEKIEDTLLDLINYSAMGLAKLKGYN